MPDRRPSLTARSAERRLVLLTLTRWFPVGLVFGLTVLLPLERGLSLTETGSLLAVQGFVVLALELPTGGLADSLGRRPLLIVSGVLALVSTAVFASAETFGAFAVAMMLQGVFRALDSGPLEAWFVDTALAHAPDAPIERGLSRAATALGSAIAGGAVVGGGLIAWHPVAGQSALVLPFVVAGVLYGLHTVLVAVLVREERGRAPGRDGARASVGRRGTNPFRHRLRHSAMTSLWRPFGVVADGLRMLRTAPVLRSLVLVEVFWSVAMIAFETVTPVRLADFVGGEDAAGALFGPASAAAWVLFAAGSALAGSVSRHAGVTCTAIGSRILNGLFVMAMGLVAGPIGLISAFWLAYLTHGAAGPMHNALLHRQATGSNRAVVLSINSMVGGGSYSLGLLVLTPLAETAGTGFAFVVAGAFSLLGALLYLPALRQERAR
ncbi:MFS transporter [Herbiconiux liangxiaofengii]|uniref:MFS transporter n=1 Tax=Herbiconiux liangxiaofengii TaxID=3342795 RepID=UPI0035B7F588